jgi:hypothetical protein
MTTISAMASGMTRQSPLDHMKSVLSDEVSSGSIAESDESALSSALDSIDESLKSDAESSSSSSTSSSSTKTDMKSKIEGLIDDQVTSGTLTDDQASELKKLFTDTAPKQGAGAGAPPPPPDDASSSTSTSSSSSSTTTTSDGTSTTDSTSTDDSTSSALADFLATLKAQQGGSTYGSNGGLTSASSSLVLDTEA